MIKDVFELLNVLIYPNVLKENKILFDIKKKDILLLLFIFCFAKRICSRCCTILFRISFVSSILSSLSLSESESSSESCCFFRRLRRFAFGSLSFFFFFDDDWLSCSDSSEFSLVLLLNPLKSPISLNSSINLSISTISASRVLRTLPTVTFE